MVENRVERGEQSVLVSFGTHTIPFSNYTISIATSFLLTLPPPFPSLSFEVAEGSS